MLAQVIPFVAGGFMYIGAVAVLPTYVLPSFLGTTSDFSQRVIFGRLLAESKSGKQALREVRNVAAHAHLRPADR